MQNELLKVTGLSKWFRLGGGLFKPAQHVKAVNNVSFSVPAGTTLGIVGESGCGKSTLGRTVLRLYEPTAGSIEYRGQDVAHFKGQDLFELRRNLQMIFQDSYDSLNPRMRVGNIIEEPLHIHGIGTPEERSQRVLDLLEIVGLSPKSARKFPHEFSGGQRQRLDIARALVLQPEIIVCDEAVSALDVSIQAQIINLLKKLQKKFNLTYLFISHDISVIRHISDTVMVMYLGEVVEMAPKDRFFERPSHPYSQALLSAVPSPELDDCTEQVVLSGDVPSPIDPPEGCCFHTRCPLAIDACKTTKPELRVVSPGHKAACHRLEDAIAAPLCGQSSGGE